MSFDGKANFAIAPVIVAPSPAVSGLTVTVLAGQGSLFTGTPPYNLTVWEPLPPLGQPTKAFAEIVRVEKVEGDTITFSARAQEGTTAKQIGPGWVIADTITVKALTDIEKAVEEGSTGLASEVAARQAGDSTNATAISNEKARAEGVEILKATIASLNSEASAREAADDLRLVKSENLKDLLSAATARANLGLGTAAVEPLTAFDPKGAAASAQTAAEGVTATEKTRAEAAEALKAPLASPALTGSPTAPTQTLGDNSTKLATTAFSAAAVAVEKGRAETAEATKASSASLTSETSAREAADATNATAISTEKTRAEGQEVLKAPLASPALTGTPTAPTATAGTNTTQLASTAFATTAKSEAESKGIPLTQKGAASGVAELTASSKLPIAELPAPNAGGHYETNFGNGSASSFVIKHELKTLTPDISIVNQSTGLEEGCRKKVLNENEIELSATAWEITPPGAAAYRVSVDASSGLVATNGSVLTSYALKSEVGANSGIAPLEGVGKLPEARLPSSVVSSSAAIASGVPLGTYSGVDPTGVADSTTAVLAALAAAQGSGPNGTNKLVWCAPGTTLKMSQPIPMYNGMRFVGDPLGSGNNGQAPNCTIVNTTTDIFEPPSGASGTLVSPRIEGFYFQGSGPLSNTHVITPQPLDGTGWVIADLYFRRNAWQFFQSALCGTFVRPHLSDFNGGNCSSKQLVLYGSDGWIGGESFLDGILVGNPARWPTVTSGEAGSWVQNNIVALADTHGNLYFFRANTASTSVAPVTAAPVSSSTWTYVGTQLSASPGSSAYSSGTTYGTIGTLVTSGGQTYYNLTVQGSAGNPPPGTSTSGARRSTPLWGWVDTYPGTASVQTPGYHIEFAMAHTFLDKVYITACPCSAILFTGTCTGSQVGAGVRSNAFAPNRHDNSGNQLPGSDGPAFVVSNLSGSASFPNPSGALTFCDGFEIINASQSLFGIFGSSNRCGLFISDSQHVYVGIGVHTSQSWSGGPTILSFVPYRVIQTSNATTDIRFKAPLQPGNATTAYVGPTSGTVSKIFCENSPPVTFASGTNTIPVWLPAVFMSGGTNSLPAASTVFQGQPCYVTNTTASPIALGSAGGNINNGSSLSVPAFSTVACVSDGTNWWAT